MDQFEVFVGEEPEEVFSPQSEALLCEQVLGDRRHGLQPPSPAPGPGSPPGRG
jgi:hypothetical protein